MNLGFYQSMRILIKYLEGEDLSQVFVSLFFCTVSLSFAAFGIFYILLPLLNRIQYTEYTKCTVSNSKYACTSWTCTIQFTFFNSIQNKTEVGYQDGCKIYMPCWQLKVNLFLLTINIFVLDRRKS